MAVDANVLIFERIREELAIGKTVRSAIDIGFSRAFGTIVDSNLTTLIAALFLFQFGTGPVKGFAVTLIDRPPSEHVHRGVRVAHHVHVAARRQGPGRDAERVTEAICASSAKPTSRS